ncbi:alpha/beta fold hydrolase, partial [Rhodococcus sp. (in: high G+C Gram-positive bacteria)]|uniref:alpha/beta fold hydrolase n=1 Tax=Rhodococcus sp. TaxID=1831 RepID=UPI00338F56AA
MGQGHTTAHRSGLPRYRTESARLLRRRAPEGVDAYKIEHLVADVVGLLDALGLSDAHLVGHDWGSAVAWQVAGRHPNRIRSLTAISVP